MLKKKYDPDITQLYMHNVFTVLPDVQLNCMHMWSLLLGIKSSLKAHRINSTICLHASLVHLTFLRSAARRHTFERADFPRLHSRGLISPDIHLRGLTSLTSTSHCRATGMKFLSAVLK